MGDAQTGFQVVDQLGGRINTVTVQDGIAYVGVGPRLWLLDVSQPETPAALGQSDILPGLIQRIAVLNDTAYVLTNDESGFWIVDVSHPKQPQIVDFFETALAVNFLQEWNGRLYVGPTAREENTLIFSVDDPLQPVLAGELPYEYYPMSDDQFVYASRNDGENPITILMADATELSQLSPVAEFTTNLTGYFIAVDQDRFYFLTFEPSFSIWTIEKQNFTGNPTKLNELLLSYTFDSIHVEDDLLYELENASDAGFYAAGIKVFDISDPEHVRQLTRLRIGNRYYNYLIDENIIYIAAGESLVIAEISKDTGLQKLAEWRGLGDLDWIETNADQLFALNDLDHRIYQFEVDSAQTLRLLYEYKHDQMYIDQAILSGNAVFTTGWWAGIHRFQTDVIPWQETAVFNSPIGIETVSNMTVQGNYLYAYTSENDNLVVLDISDPTQLQRVGELEQSSNYPQLAVDNERLFVWTDHGSGQGFRIISIADPTMPEEIGAWQDPLQAVVGDLVVRDNLVYLLTPSLLRIIDVTDVAHMTVLASLPIAGGATHLMLLDDKLLLGGDKIKLVDITNPTQPQLIGELTTPGNALDAVEYNGLIYVADGAGGLLVLRLAE
ncbi:MAG TPA: hypothetical protein PLD25_24545 [Chloroflexota bacterium]|nr:hypothetical protein [Chloroflexota bacterium]HUM70694.1 hypothetical protein [Chloroflexota bacterium]